MAKESNYNTELSELSNGINIDIDPSLQPRGSRRFTLNTVERSSDNQTNLSNESSNIATTNFPDGYIPIGDRYIGNGDTFVILQNQDKNRQDIGLIDSNDIYTSIINTNVLNCDIRYQCEVKYRIRRGNERVVYWVDGLNNARTLNLDRLYDFYSNSYQIYLRAGGDPNLFTGEKWDRGSFDLIKSYLLVPTFNNVEILEYGSILPGSYNFAIQYVDDDLNPTEWITTSNTVNIFNDNLDSPYEKIRGSRNITSSSQSFPRASKSIRLTIGNLDTNFPYYRIAIIRSAGNTGEPDKTLASDLYATSNSIFIYSGNDSNLSEVNIADILIGKEVIFAPRHIEQQENILLLLHTRGKGINWCDFQEYASKIKSDLTTKEVILNSAFSDPNVKNAKSTFIFHGNMPGEVYSYGISYLFDDGYVSPAFHIPGKNPTDTGSNMSTYEIDNNYLDIHNCTSGNYWGVDNLGETLVGKPIRHHRFPFRHEVGKPLVTTTTNSNNINKYKLSLVFSLNPAFTPSPNTYPVDINGSPILISYKINYQVTGAATPASFNGTLVDTDVSLLKNIVIYDDTSPLSTISGAYYQLMTSQLSTYQTGGNNRFIITPTYEVYVLTTVQNTDKSEIFGIEFSNITKPHPNVVGFYIVRNERQDEDRLIIDNALVGTMTKFSNYKSFGLVMPKQYYHVDNCGTANDSGKTLEFCNDSVWFFNPEYQFLQKKVDFNSLIVEGSYSETSYEMPVISDVEGSICNSGHSKGVYINDVQAGTTYNPDINKAKNKDDDGFDLVIGYRNTNVSFSSNTTNLSLPIKSKVIYLNAATYQNFNFDTYYNVSVDNKIGMYLPQTPIPDMSILHNTGNNTNKLLYCSMLRDSTSSYSNFINRPYYKEHNNPILFGDNNVINNVEIFNGDAEISALNLVSTVFYDIVGANRDKKSSLWKIIVGVDLILIGIVLAIPSAGASLALSIPAATALAGLAISYGVSLITSGITLEQLKLMAQVDYAKGLKDTITDGGVYETIREEVETADDTIRWFSDRVSNLYIESAVPFGLRSGLTSGVPDFIDAPTSYNEDNFRSYLTEKLTTLDTNQGSGRLYRGFASSEIYDMNLDYMRFNKQKILIHLPIEYDCCSDFNDIFPRRVWASQQSFQEEKIDNYRSFLPNNYVDIEGEHGEITGVYKLGNNLFIQTREGTWQLPQNKQERVTNEIVSFIGTGSIFSILPRKVVDDDLGSLGTLHKWANIKTRMGVFTISETESKIFLHSDGIKEISSDGIKGFCDDFIVSFLANQMYNIFKIRLLNTNNTANPSGTGYISVYDNKYDRIIFTKKDYLLLVNKIDSLVIVSQKPIDEESTDFVFNTEDELFYQGINVIPYSDRDYFEDKSFSLSYSLKTRKWVSWHSFLPNYYIHSKNRFYSYIDSSNSLWKHNIEGNYQTFYGIYYPHIIEGVSKSEDLSDRIFEDINIHTKAIAYSPVSKQFIDKRLVTFNKITIYNERQCSTELSMQVKQSEVPKKDYFSQQTKNILGDIIIDREIGGWFINRFRDYVVDYDESIFISDWENIKDIYFIDRVINSLSSNTSKNWQELQSFKGKYIVFRLKFDNFDNVNLITDYLVTNTQVSI